MSNLDDVTTPTLLLTRRMSWQLTAGLLLAPAVTLLLLATPHTSHWEILAAAFAQLLIARLLYQRLKRIGKQFDTQLIASAQTNSELTQLHAVEQKAVRRALEASEERFRAFWNVATDAMVVCNAQGIVELANPSYCQLYSITPEEIVGQPVTKVFPEAARPWAWDYYQRMIDQGSSGQRFESVIRHHNGATQVVQSQIDFLNENGNRAMLAVIRDITEHTHQTAGLYEREVFLQAVLDAVSYEIAILDRSGTILTVNAAWRQFAQENGGCGPDNGIGMNYLAICQVASGSSQAAAQAVGAGIRAIIAGEQESFAYEYACHGPESQRWFIARGTRFGGNGPAAVVLAHEEVTARRLAAAEIQGLNTRLATQLADLRQHTRELTLLGELGDMLRTCTCLPDVFTVVTRSVQFLFEGSDGILFIRRSPHPTLEAVVMWGNPSDALRLAPDGCRALQRGQIHAVVDTVNGLCCEHTNPATTRSTLCVPLLDQGEVQGVLSLSWKEPNGLTQSHQRLAQAVAGQIELTLANLRLQENLRAQAVRDPLTGLFNRRYLEETLERAFAQTARNGHPFAILVVDIDHFKQVNDTYGHDAGDTVLRMVSKFLRSHIRASDIACRYGGEEFVLVLIDAGKAAAQMRAEALRVGISHMVVQHRGQPIPPLTISIGVALAPEHGNNSAAVIGAADVALYAAKRSGRNCVVFAEPLENS